MNGSGTKGNPYMICDWAQLDNVRLNLNSHFRLMKDLGPSDANYNIFGTNWLAIGANDYCSDGSCNKTNCEKEFGCGSRWMDVGDNYCAPPFSEEIGEIEVDVLEYRGFCVESESNCVNVCGGYWYNGSCEELHYKSKSEKMMLCSINSQTCGDCYFYDYDWDYSGYGVWTEVEEAYCVNSKCSDESTCEKSYGCDSVWNEMGFKGSFDGVGFEGDTHSINNLVVRNGHFSGLFGRVNGEITNLVVNNVDVSTGGTYFGGLVAHLNGGRIENCDVSGTVAMVGGYNPSSRVGGLVGIADNGAVIKNSSSTATVSGRQYAKIGGLVGELIDSNLSTSYANGIFSGTDQGFPASRASSVGGIAGVVTRSNINDVYALGGTQGWLQEYSYGGGGVFGEVNGSSENVSNIRNVFAVLTNATITTYKGLIAGKINNTFIRNTYVAPQSGWVIFGSKDVSTVDDGGGSTVKTQTTTNLKKYATFKNDGWDIALIDDYDGETWVIGNNDYPKLGWELTR